MFNDIIWWKFVVNVWHTFNFLFFHEFHVLSATFLIFQEDLKVSLSIINYFMWINDIFYTLSALDEPITNDQLLIYIFGRLSYEFDVIIVNLQLRKNYIPLKEAQFLLHNYEMRLSKLNYDLNIDGPSTNFIAKQCHKRNNHQFSKASNNSPFHGGHEGWEKWRQNKFIC